MLLLILCCLLLPFHIVKSDPLDSCARIDSCTKCVNSTDGFGYKCQWCSATNVCASEVSTSSNCHVNDWTLHEYNCPKDISNVNYDEHFMRTTAVPLIAATCAPSFENLRLPRMTKQIGRILDDDERDGLISSFVEALFTDTEALSDLLRSLQSCFNENDQIEIINAYEIFCDITKITTCFGYSAYLKNRNAMVLAFRGSNSLFQMIDQGISFFLNPKIPFNVTRGVVDGYYLKAFYSLWEKGMKDDVEKVLKEKDGVKLWFFGHSLGGGLASIASSYVAKVYGMDRNRTKLVTFGMPRIGDIDLAEAHDKLVPDSWRIEHSKDPIPAVPPRTFPDGIDKGSFHHNTEIWYPQGMDLGDSFEIGSRPDTTVLRSLFPFNIEDHFSYFNVYLEDWWINGCNGDDKNL